MSQHSAGSHVTDPATGVPDTTSRSRWGRRALVATVVGAGTIGSLGLTATTASAATTADWEKLASCESGGNWSINTGNGYYGGVQFSSSTWLGYGGGAYARTANLATESEQVAIANKVLASQGWGAWPSCSVKEGLSGLPTTGGPTTAPGGSPGSTTHTKVRHATRSTAPTGHVTLSKTMYTVRVGDTLGTIATREHVVGGWRTLWAANVKALPNPDLIRVGERLHLPAAHTTR